MSDFTVNFEKPEQFKHREQIKTVLKTASQSQQLQLLQKKIGTTEEGSIERQLMAEKIAELSPLVKSGKKYFFGIGAIRSGKTFLYLALICFFCKFYPRSRWLVVRKSSSVLLKTTVPSFELVVAQSEGLYWKKNDREFYCQFPNGSRVYFMSEGYESDKNLTKFLGLECNGAFLDQMDELQAETYVMVLSRLGSWYGVDGPMPPLLMFGSTNPTFNWFKRLIYDPWKKFLAGQLDTSNVEEMQKTLYSPEAFDIIELLPENNPFVTDDQKENWEHLPPDDYARLIRGAWDIAVTGQFCTSFSSAKHISPVELSIDTHFEIVLSFDFNVDPMTCTISQTDKSTFFRIIKELRIENSDTPAMCDAIRPIIAGREHTVMVTGDASGKNRMSGLRGHISHYQVIKQELGLDWGQFEVPSVNPFISDSRMHMNAILHSLPEFLISPSCEYTIQDLKFVLCDINREGDLEIKKTGINPHLGIDNKKLGHLLDTVRYALNVCFPGYVHIHRS